MMMPIQLETNINPRSLRLLLNTSVALYTLGKTEGLFRVFQCLPKALAWHVWLFGYQSLKAVVCTKRQGSVPTAWIKTSTVMPQLLLLVTQSIIKATDSYSACLNANEVQTKTYQRARYRRHRT